MTHPTLCGLRLNQPRLMGILNVTPDSFSDGGQYADAAAAVARARAMKAAGADLIDVGGESTRPGADEVSVDEELGRVIPVIESLVAEGLGPVSIDTRKAQRMIYPPLEQVSSLHLDYKASEMGYASGVHLYMETQSKL